MDETTEGTDCVAQAGICGLVRLDLLRKIEVGKTSQRSYLDPKLNQDEDIEETGHLLLASRW